MKQFNYTITDPVGIHARPAGQVAKLAKAYPGTTVTVTKGETTVKASQLMKLMNLNIKQGEEIAVAAEGPDEEAAISALETFFKENL